MQVPLNFFKAWAPAMRDHAASLGKERGLDWIRGFFGFRAEGFRNLGVGFKFKGLGLRFWLCFLEIIPRSPNNEDPAPVFEEVGFNTVGGVDEKSQHCTQ